MRSHHQAYATWLWIWLLCWASPTWAQTKIEITPSHVYTQALQVEQELDILRQHFHITGHNPATAVDLSVDSRHVWQKAYMILLKLSIFRRKQGLTGFAPASIEPGTQMDPARVWEQIARVLTEIRSIKYQLGITQEIGKIEPAQNKRKIDVFNKLNQLSYDLDLLIGEAIASSHVYAEVLRLNEEINAIARKTGSAENAIPPARLAQATPKESLSAAFTLMSEIQRLQQQLGLAITDFSIFRKEENVIAADTFNMVNLCIAELQTVKAQLGMRHNITPAAEQQMEKTSVDVVQLLGYLTHKLQLVNLR